MNKLGFTLIELLATIAIMGLVATIASFNILKLFDDKENKATKTEENIIKEAACVYIELDKNAALKEKCLTYGCEISTDSLIESGLLKEEDVNNNIVINIYQKNNEKICTIKED